MAKDNVVEFERLVLMHFHGSPLKKSTFVGVVVTSALSLALAACGGSSTSTAAGGCTPGSNATLPKLSSVKTVGFSQNALDGAWRNAESDSMAKAVAAKGWNPVIQTNANNSDSQQVQDINTLINDKVDVLVIAPHTEDAEVQAIIKARQACIPVFLVDRDVNHSTASVGRDYVTFLGSDFMKQGATAADQMIDALGGPRTHENMAIATIFKEEDWPASVDDHASNQPLAHGRDGLRLFHFACFLARSDCSTAFAAATATA